MSPEPARLAVRGFGVAISLVDRSGIGVAARVAARLPPDLIGRASRTPDLVYDIRSGRHHRDGVSITRDGEPGCVDLPPVEAARWLGAEIDSELATRATDAVFVHAGVVGWRGHAIVIPGRSGTGKSHLVAELVRRGATYYSDEFAVIDDRGWVHSYARALAVAATEFDTWLLDASIRPERRPPLPLCLVAGLNYRPGTSWSPTVRTGARAVLPLVDNTIVGREEPARALAMGKALASRVVAVCGARPDAALIALDLLERVDAIIDGSAVESAEEKWPDRIERIEAARRRATGPVGGALRYEVLPDFLAPEERGRLVELVLAKEAEFLPSMVLSEGQGLEDRENRKSRTLFNVEGAGPIFERAIRPILPYLRRELGMGWFSPEITEVQVTVHEDGSFFKPHLDLTPTAQGWRALTCVYHFSIERDFEGGELVLYDTADGRIDERTPRVVVPPVENTLVCFPSQTLHEVRPVHRTATEFRGNRFAVSIWFWDNGFRPWGGGSARARPATEAVSEPVA